MAVREALVKGSRLPRLGLLFATKLGAAPAGAATTRASPWSMPDEPRDVDMTSTDDAGTASATHVSAAGSAAALQAAFSPASGLTASALATPAPPAPGQPKAESLSVAGSASAAPSVGDKRKSNYFEFAKKKWESEDAFRLPDGTCWPQVQEGAQGADHGVVVCRLCARHEKTNNFAEGYRKGKRSALVDHQAKNKEHKALVAEMERGLKRVMLVAGVAQRLLGKVAVVTGGAKGIGLACASCLGHEGCRVVIADVDDEAAAKAVQQLALEGVAAAAAHCDVSKKAEVDQLIRFATEEFGGVDIMVANAGIVKGAEFLDMREEDFDAVIGVNLKGVFLCGQAAARQMVEQNRAAPGRGGAIINMSSVNAVMAIPSIAGYNASKGGVNNLTRNMALSLAPHNIRVNAIGPGSIMTPVLAAVASDRAAMNRVLSRTPMGRVGDPCEIGQVASFLASDAASYITGQVIYADGGRLALNYVVPVVGDPPA